MPTDVPTWEEVLPWLVLSVVLAGCSQLRTVTVPAGEATINLKTDTSVLAEYPPVDMPGIETQPTDRTLINDTASTPALQVQRVEVDRRPDQGQVRFFWEDGRRTVRDDYPIPVYGEMLVWSFGSTRREGFPLRSVMGDTGAADTQEPKRDTVYRPIPQPMAEIIGTPRDETVKAEVTSEPPWYRKLWAQVRMILAFVAGALTSYVIVKLVPGL